MKTEAEIHEAIEIMHERWNGLGDLEFGSQEYRDMKAWVLNISSVLIWVVHGSESFDHLLATSKCINQLKKKQ